MQAESLATFEALKWGLKRATNVFPQRQAPHLKKGPTMQRNLVILAVCSVLLIPAYGCATTGSDDMSPDSEPAAEQTPRLDPDLELEYRDLAPHFTSMGRSMGERWDVDFSGEGDARFYIANGPEARELLRGEPEERQLLMGNERSVFLAALFEREDAQIGVFDTADSPYGPRIVLMVPMPMNVELPPDTPPEIFQLFELGIVHSGAERLLPDEVEELVENYEATDEPLTFETLDEASLAELVEEGGSFLVILTSEYCGASARFAPFAQWIFDNIEIDVPVYRLPWEVVGEDRLSSYLAGQRVGFPSLYFFEDGQIVDIYRGGGADQQTYHIVRTFLHQNGQLDSALPYHWDYQNLPEDPTDRIRAMSQRSNYPFSNFEGAELDGVHWEHGQFTGSSFRNASLRGARFNHSLLSHVDFTGADLTDAQLDNVFWSRTTCPDGTLSDDNGGTCEGHLEVR